jgi:hypothetical protein
MNIEDKQKLKDELMKFAEYCNKVGGTGWSNIPERGVDSYLKQIDIDEKCKGCPFVDKY